MLQDRVEILTPLQEVTDFTQGENVVTASFVLPYIMGLRKSLESLSVKFNSRMILTLKQSLNKRMAKYEDNEIFWYASTLDPRFMLKWCSHPDDIISKFTDFVICISQTEVTDDTKDPTQPKPPKQRKKNPSNCRDTFSPRPLSLTRQLTAIQQKLFNLKLLHIFPINTYMYLKKQILYNFGKKTHPCIH